MSPSLRHLAVVSINRDKYSETFIHQAFDGFPCRKTLLYGDYLPTHFTHDRRHEGKAIPKAKLPFWKRRPKEESIQKTLNLKHWLLQNKVDAVFANYGPSGVAMAPICTDLKLPMVVHFHGYDAYRADVLSTYGRDYAQLFSCAQAMVVVSVDMARQLVHLGADRKKIHTLVYGVDAMQFPEQPYPSGPFTFLFVGRFIAKKAPDLLLQAFHHVKSRMPDIRLKMVGDGEMLEGCKQWTQEKGIMDSVDFLGVLPPEKVAQTMGECHALVLPSHRTPEGDHEGTPLVILEAGACARPVIGTYHGGIQDVIRHRKNGLLVAENAPDALAQAMMELAGNPLQAAALGKKARVDVLDHHPHGYYHQKLWNLLVDVRSQSQIP